MKVFAISDLHLATTTNKPMDIFGGAWENYWERIQESWCEQVGEEDVVLIAGDISWAMHNEEAISDLTSIASLPGKKVIIRGNHDYWWSSYNKVKEILPPSVNAIQNDAIKFGKFIICGTRGWTVPISSSTEQDIKLYEREQIRLNLTLTAGEKMRAEGDKLILMIHYPPFNWAFEDSAFTELIEKFKVDIVVYGHLHGKDCRSELVVNKHGIPYLLTSCDKLNNQVKFIAEE